MGKNSHKAYKVRYPSRAFATVYWVAIGIGFVLMWTIPLTGWYYGLSYIEAVGLGSSIWMVFFLGSLFYTIRYGLRGIRKCPNCGRQNYRGRKHCMHCGARVFWFCPKCGTRTIKHKEFCECGQSLKVITFARQVEFEDIPKNNEEKPPKNNIVVTGSLVQFCPACGAEITEDLTHCVICGSKLEKR